MNWTTYTLTVTGRGAPKPSASNIAAARVEAEKTARSSVQAAVMQALKNIRVRGAQTAAEAVQAFEIALEVPPELDAEYGAGPIVAGQLGPEALKGFRSRIESRKVELEVLLAEARAVAEE